MLENFEFNIHSCLWTILIWLVSFEMRALVDSIENVWNYMTFWSREKEIKFISLQGRLFPTQVLLSVRLSCIYL